MIANQWYVLLESDEVKRQPVGVTRMGEKMVFWRDGDGKVICMPDKCCHRGIELSTGVVLDNGRLQCPFHGFEYDATGRVVVIPANGRSAPVPRAFHVPPYPTHEAHGFIWVWWGRNPPDDLAPPQWFADVDDSLYYKTAHDPWDTHYSRVIENQLDVVHVPFIHHNTIGRGNRTLVDGPGMEWVGANAFNLYTYNRLDDGTRPRTPEEVPVPNPDHDFRLEFIFPNLWENRISEKMRVVIAFAPVDETRTWLYLRAYQKIMTLPLLRDAFGYLLLPFNLYVAHQDRRVVNTHEPPASALRMGEQLIRGDRPIIEYRRRRQELMDAARSSE
jgi:phenylpropionate dioxygenase-like ring-hydroxylating dioxygenase large terminal subunit